MSSLILKQWALATPEWGQPLKTGNIDANDPHINSKTQRVSVLTAHWKSSLLAIEILQVLPLDSQSLPPSSTAPHHPRKSVANTTFHSEMLSRSRIRCRQFTRLSVTFQKQKSVREKVTPPWHREDEQLNSSSIRSISWDQTSVFPVEARVESSPVFWLTLEGLWNFYASEKQLQNLKQCKADRTDWVATQRIKSGNLKSFNSAWPSGKKLESSCMGKNRKWRQWKEKRVFGP